MSSSPGRKTGEEEEEEEGNVYALQEYGRERGGACKDSSSWVSQFEPGLKCVFS